MGQLMKSCETSPIDVLVANLSFSVVARGSSRAGREGIHPLYRIINVFQQASLIVKS